MDLLQIDPSARNESGVKDHVPTKIVTLKVRLGDGEHVNPDMHLFQEGEKAGQGSRSRRRSSLHTNTRTLKGNTDSVTPWYADTRCRVTSQA